MSIIIQFFASLLANKELIFAVVSSVVELVNLVSMKWNEKPAAA